MIAELGHFALALALFVAIVQATLPLIGARIEVGGASGKMVFCRHPQHEGVTIYSESPGFVDALWAAGDEGIRAQLRALWEKRKRARWGIAGWVGAAVVVGGSARGGAGGAAAVVWGLGEVRPTSSPRRSAASSAFTAALSRLDFSRSSSSCKRAVSASTASLFFLGVVSGLSAFLLQERRPSQPPRGALMARKVRCEFCWLLAAF